MALISVKMAVIKSSRELKEVLIETKGELLSAWEQQGQEPALRQAGLQCQRAGVDELSGGEAFSREEGTNSLPAELAPAPAPGLPELPPAIIFPKASS